MYKNFNNDIIKVKKSSIKNAGYGVFAKVFIPSDTILEEYKGEKISLKDVKKMNNNKYLFQINLMNGKTKFIDANNLDKSNWTSFVNSVRTNYQKKNKQNTEYIQIRNKIILKTIKDINKDTELICDYGSNYW